jgi:hypothetical protein
MATLATGDALLGALMGYPHRFAGRPAEHIDQANRPDGLACKDEV